MSEDVTARLAEALCTVVGVDRSDADESSLQEAVTALLPVVQRLAVEKAAEELRAVAKAWQWGAWADTPRHADRIADRIGAAQYVTDWLLARAAALAAAALTADAPLAGQPTTDKETDRG